MIKEYVNYVTQRAPKFNLQPHPFNQRKGLLKNYFLKILGNFEDGNYHEELNMISVMINGNKTRPDTRPIRSRCWWAGQQCEWAGAVY